MKIFKRWACLLTALAMVLSMAVFSPLGAEAAEVLELHNSVMYTPASRDAVAVFTFTPQVTDRYGIYATDPDARLYVALSQTDGLYGEPYYGWGLCEIQAELTAGVTYTIQLTGVENSVDVGVAELQDIESFDIHALSEFSEGYVDPEVSFTRLLEVAPKHADISRIAITNENPAIARGSFYGDRMLITFLEAGEADVTFLWGDTHLRTTARAARLKPLPLDQELTVQIDPQSTILDFADGYVFVPPESGTYTFYARGMDTGLAMGAGLYDDLQYSTYMPNWDANVLCVRLEAGKKYRVSLSAGPDQDYTASIGVVKAAPVTKITPDADLIRGDAGYHGFMEMELGPELADISGLRVTSSDENVVTASILDETLYYTLRQAGTAELTVSCGDASATIPVTVNDAGKLVPGLNEKEPDKDADAMGFTFVPEKTGDYRLWSDTSDDVYVAVYNQNADLIASDDDSGEDNNFDTSFSAQAGQQYYVQIEFWSEPTGTLKFWLEEVAGIRLDEALTVELEPGESVSYSFVAPEGGVYDLYTPDENVELYCQGADAGYEGEYRPEWRSTDAQIPLEEGERCSLTVGNAAHETREVTVYLVKAAQPESVSMDQAEVTYTLGSGGIRMYCTVMPAHADYTSLRWSVSDPEMVVYGYGDEAVLYPENLGTFTVTAQVGSVSDSARLTVITPPLLQLGQTVNASLQPYGTTTYTFTAEQDGVYGFYTPSQDVALFSYNRDGDITGFDTYVPSWGVSELQVELAAGESCTIQLYNYTNLTQTVPVSVVVCTEAKELHLDTDRMYLRHDGVVHTLALDVLPEHSVLPRVEARSSDGSVVYVEYYGLWVDVMGLAEGTATVYVTAGDQSWEIPVTVCAVLRGDVNGDTTVDGADAMLLRQFVAKWKLDSFNQAAADVNDDGIIDGEDAMLLRRMIAG